MFYFIEHNRTTKHTNCTEYVDYDEAHKVCFLKELDYYQLGRGEMEVVIFEANSLDELKRTHSRYFARPKKEDNSKGALMAVGLVGLALYLLK